VSLAVLEDLIAVEDVCDLSEGAPLLRWLARHGLLDASRVVACVGCGAPFVRHPLANNRRYCSASCCKRSWRKGPMSDRRAA
jgi:hypothetical protein